MTKREIFLDVLHIIWYIGWRAVAITAGFLAIMYLANWTWWQA